VRRELKTLRQASNLNARRDEADTDLLAPELKNLRFRYFDGVDWINNTMCTNVDAAVRSIQAYERPLVLIAGGKDKGLDFDPLGRVIAERVKALVAIGADGPAIAAAARKHGFERIETAGSMREAVRKAAGQSRQGDVVMLAPACASFDWYTSFEARGRDFKNEVRALQEDPSRNANSTAV